MTFVFYTIVNSYNKSNQDTESTTYTITYCQTSDCNDNF